MPRRFGIYVTVHGVGGQKGSHARTKWHGRHKKEEEKEGLKRSEPFDKSIKDTFVLKSKCFDNR